VEDIPATLEAEQMAFATEAADINATLQYQRAAAVVTVQAAETQASELTDLNRVLLATVRVGERPTQGRIPAIMDESSLERPQSLMDDMDIEDGTEGVTASMGDMQITQIATANSVRESDGCASSVQSQFPADVSQVYLTAVARNLQAGTAFTVEWRFEDQIQDRSDWVAPNNVDSLCIWFFTEGPLQPGNWSARLYVNGAPIEPATSFLIG
jgi:hypothetical protein